MMTVQLIELAHDGSHAGRLALLRKLTDAYFETDKDRPEAEAALLEEIVVKVAGQLEPSARAEVAGLYATQSRAPREIVFFFACDIIEVAQPVLQLSTVLTDQDLIEVALRFSEPHLIAIGRRRSISEPVSDVLVRCGSNAVLGLVIANPGARFSLYGFSVLVRRAHDDERLQLELLRRQDRPSELENEFLAILNDGLKRLLHEADDAARRRIAGELLRRWLTRTTRERAARRGGVLDLLLDIQHGRTDVGTELVILAENDRAFDLATVLNALTGLDLSGAMTALTGPRVEPLLGVMRCLDLPWTACEAALRLRARRHRRIYVPDPEERRTFDAMSDDSARGILHQLKALDRGATSELARSG